MKPTGILTAAIMVSLVFGWAAVCEEPAPPEGNAVIAETPEPNEGAWGEEQHRPGRDRPFRHGARGVGERLKNMQQKHEEYLSWLKENYPDEAAKLEEVRQNNPELYMRQVMQSVRKYGRIAEASRDNPELAAVLKKDVELKARRDEILERLASAQAEEKEALTAELRQIVSKRFDLIVQRKQLQHKKLLERLEELKKQVERSEAEVKTWKMSKDEKVEARLNELLERSEKFRWD